MSNKVKLYPLCECFYEIIRRCITIPFLTKLTDYCANAVTYDKVERAMDNSTVLYTSSCVDVTTALLKPLGNYFFIFLILILFFNIIYYLFIINIIFNRNDYRIRLLFKNE